MRRNARDLARGQPVFEPVIRLVPEQVQRERGISEEAYGQYMRALHSVPGALELLAQSKVYLTYDRLTLDELEIVLDATAQLARNIAADTR